MTASEIRTEARKSLIGKWGTAALLTLIYLLIMFVIELVCNFIPVIGSIAFAVINLPITFGFTVTFMKLKRNEEVSNTDFLSTGFSSFSKVWGIYGHVILKMIIPICLMIVFLVVGIFSTISASISSSSGFSLIGFIAIIGYIISLVYAICKGLLYSLVNFILYDNPNMTGKEIVEESERLMSGNRCMLFWLNLTFIGWVFLASFTLGIGFLWLTPYIIIAQICFYESLAGKETSSSDNDPISEN